MTEPNTNPIDPRQDSQNPQYGQSTPQYAQQPQYAAPQNTPPYGQPNSSPYGQPYGTPQYGQYGAPTQPGQPGQPLPQGMPAYANAGFGTQGAQGPQVWYQPGNPPLDQPWYGIGFGRAVGRFFRKYAVFSGRASRSEFWWVMLFFVLVSWAMGMVLSPLSLVTGPATQTVVNALWVAATIVPTASLFVRRLHDSNRSGWWLLLPGIPYVICQLWDLLFSSRMEAAFNGMLRSMLPYANLAGVNSVDAADAEQASQLVRQLAGVITPEFMALTGFISLMGLIWFISMLVLSLARTNPAGARFDAH